MRLNLFGRYTNNMILLLSSITLGSCGQILMKVGATNAQISNPIAFLHTILNPFILVGLGAYIISSFIWLIVLTRLPLSVAYPFGALSYVFIVVAAIFSGENVTIQRLLGVICIIIGILIVGKFSKNT